MKPTDGAKLEEIPNIRSLRTRAEKAEEQNKCVAAIHVHYTLSIYLSLSMYISLSLLLSFLHIAPLNSFHPRRQLQIEMGALKREKAEMVRDLNKITREVKTLRATDSELKEMFKQLQEFHAEIMKTGKVS